MTYCKHFQLDFLCDSSDKFIYGVIYIALHIEDFIIFESPKIKLL